MVIVVYMTEFRRQYSKYPRPGIEIMKLVANTQISSGQECWELFELPKQANNL